MPRDRNRSDPELCLGDRVLRCLQEARWTILGIEASPTTASSTCTKHIRPRTGLDQLNVSKEELQKAVDKVGNSASAVRKQLNAGRSR